MTTTTTPVEQHKATVRELIDCVNDGRFDDIDAFVASDVEFHPLSAANDRELAGIDAYREYFARLRTAFPDEHYRIDQLVAEGDLVAARYTVSGTHTGEMMGLAPTNRSFEQVFFITYRFEDGMIAEMWGLADLFGTFAQIGLLPKMEPFLATAKPMES